LRQHFLAELLTERKEERERKKRERERRNKGATERERKERESILTEFPCTPLIHLLCFYSLF